MSSIIPHSRGKLQFNVSFSDWFNACSFINIYILIIPISDPHYELAMHTVKVRRTGTISDVAVLWETYVTTY